MTSEKDKGRGHVEEMPHTSEPPEKDAARDNAPAADEVVASSEDTAQAQDAVQPNAVNDSLEPQQEELDKEEHADTSQEQQGTSLRRALASRLGRGADKKGDTTKEPEPERPYYIPSATYGQNGHIGNRPYEPGENTAEPLKDSSNTAALVIAVVLVGAVIIGALGMWSHRGVGITLNGKATNVTYGTTVDELFQARNIQVNPGNYVSVSGKVLKKSAGWAYKVKVSGDTLNPDDAKNRHLHGGEVLEFANGANKMEPYTSKNITIQPTLKMEGDEGSISYIASWGKTTTQEMRTGKESGETAKGKTIKKGSDCVVKVCDVKPKGSKKLVALTFDDGPTSEYTERYLKVLKKENVKATFFMIGSQVEELPKVAKEVADAGHQIASHTQDHTDLTSLDSADALRSELTDSFSVIKKATGVSTSTVRPPYGNFNERAWLRSQGSLSLSVRWNQDSRDWEMPGVDAIVKNAEDGITSGSIILMHDGGGNREQGLEALPKLIKNLRKQGYEFVTLSELLASDPSIPKEISSCDSSLPKDGVWPSDLGDADKASSADADSGSS